MTFVPKLIQDPDLRVGSVIMVTESFEVETGTFLAGTSFTVDDIWKKNGRVDYGLHSDCGHFVFTSQVSDEARAVINRAFTLQL